MKIVFSPKCLEYSTLWHPESPERVKQAYEVLKNKGYEFIEPEVASEEDILRVHSKDYVEKIKSEKFYDVDTPAYKNIYEYARLSAGGAILAAKEKGFSLMRPPGHHAGRNGIALRAPTLGFCYFNNIAIAVKYLDKPTLIIDIDGHHGNGTQDIFLRDEKVKFISLHRRGIYPHTGLTSEANCLNFPLSGNAGDKLYLETLDKALKQVDLREVELVGISAGFDAHRKDMMASLGLSTECYKKIGERLAKLGLPTFAVLEGGYEGKVMGMSIDKLIQGLEG